MTVGEEPVVPDALEAIGQNVQQEAADELVRVECHALLFAAIAIILPGEADARVVACDEAAVRDGDAMRVAREIAQHLFGASERLLGVDDPVDTARGFEMT